jgi:hypothetical protein
VLYLVITKRLFGVRGGKKAYDARLRSESIMDAAIAAAAAAGRARPPTGPAPTREHEDDDVRAHADQTEPVQAPAAPVKGARHDHVRPEQL